MNRLLSILLFLVLLSDMAMARWNVDSLYLCLDQAIEQSPAFVEQHKGYVALLMDRMRNCRTLQAKYECSFSLYQEYVSFQNDSAVAYLNKCVDIAQRLGDKAKEENVKSLLAIQCSMTGDYAESYNILCQMDSASLEAEGRQNYLWASLHLYSELARYAHVPSWRRHYADKVKGIKKMIAQEFSHEDDRYLQMMEVDARDVKDFKKALAINDIRMKNVELDSHEYAIVAYDRASILKLMDDDRAARYFLAKSALCDVRLAVMDQGPIWELVNLLSGERGQFQRTCSYIKFAWDAAKNFNTAVRSRQIMSVLSTMKENYQNEITQSDKRLRLVNIVCCFLLLVILVLLLYTNRQRKRLAVTYKALRKSSEGLKNSNDQLTKTYEHLEESDRVKEVYIGYFLKLSANYVDRIEAFRKRVLQLLKNRELAKLTTMLLTDKEPVSECYHDFDSAFLSLFPNFVTEFNELLKPEERIVLEDENRLTIFIRIFACIRLGIEDNSKIAEFLHYSVNTIYNYRAKVRSGALCDKKEFEDRVRRIGMK